MATTTGRPIDIPSIGSAMRNSRSREDQIMREVGKFKPAAAPTGGGIVGQAEVWSTSGTVKANSGATEMDRFSVRWGAATDPTGQGLDVSWVSVGSSPQELALTAGWYQVSLYARLTWDVQANAPDRFDVAFYGGDDQAHINYSSLPTAHAGGYGWGISCVYNPGIFYATQTLAPELRWGSAVPAGSRTDGQLIFTITKFG